MSEERLERILDDGYLDDLASWSTDEVRRARAECEAEEEGISYARRVLQGRLDILRAELERRDHTGDEDAEARLRRLAAVLAADHVASPPAQARSTRLRVPDDAAHHEARIDALLGGAADVTSRRTDELDELIERLRAHERHLSSVRRELFDRIDALRDELARRYKDGTANVGEILSGS
jgi:septal ring factor EnvC (AmiA/AmiB activator)